MLKLEVIGNLGADARLQENVNGKFVAFNVAHTSRRTDRSTGEVVENTQWVSCTLNGNGGNLLQFLTKGTKVYVSGDMTLRTYTGNDKLQHVGINLFVRDIELCGGRSSDSELPPIPECERNSDKAF